MRLPFPTLCFLFLFPLFLHAAEPVELGKRPIELDWAGRTRSECVSFLDFESPFTWTCECENAAASFQRSDRQPIWGNFTACLTFRALTNQSGSTPTPSVRVRPPQPLPMPQEPFDSVSCWIFSYSWGRGANTDLSVPIPTLSLCFLVDGKPVEIPFRQIDWRNWNLVQLRFTPEQAALLNGPNVFFDGFRVTGGTQTFDREIYFDDLAFFAEKLAPLKPAVHRAFGPDPDLDPKFTFPTRPETIIPPSAAPDSKNALEAETGGAFRFTYAGSDGRLEVRFAPRTGTWSDLTTCWNGGAAFRSLENGGVTEIVNAQKEAEKVESAEILDVQKDGETLKIRTKIHSKTAEAVVTYALRLVGKTLVLETACDAPSVAKISFGQAQGLESPQAVPVPYWTGGQGYSARRPAVIAFEAGPGETCFLAGEVDWYSSAASYCSSLHRVDGSSAVFHEGVEYRPKTDGTRNPAFERFVVTVSPKFDEVLPFIPNPASPYKAVAGTKLWRVHAAHDRAQDRDFWLRAWRYGLREVVINDHETQWREGGESFTFRTRTDPTKGGDDAQVEYSHFLRDRLGFVYGPYNNFTDFAPVNEFWSPDRVGRLPDGNFQPSWMRTYGPKPYYAIDFCARLAPELARKFYFNSAYCDVHTSVAPWNRTDYDARVPEAGKFAATFYAYGKVMLFQKKAWAGPVYSEGPNHYFYAGLTDGNYAQDQGYRPAENPWIVNHDLRNMHDKCCNFGMGSPGMFYPQKSEPKHDTPETKDVPSDRFFCASMAFGHQGFLATQYGMRVAMRGYFNAQQLQSRYTQVSADQILYCAADGCLLNASAAIASGVSDRSQVVVKYADGTVICANGSMTEPMVCDFDGRKVDLPPNGYTGWTADGTVYTFSGLRAGKRCDYAESPEYVFLDGRDFMQRFEKAIGAGCGLCRKVDEKHWEILTLDGAQMGFKLPPAAKVTALNHENQEIGPAEFDLVNGYIYVKPVDGAFSYLVELADDPAQTASEPLKCDRWEVLAGETVEIQTPDGPEKFTIPADAPLHQRVWFTHGPNRLEFCPRPLAQIFAKADAEKITFHVKPNFPQYSALTVELNGEKKTVDGEGDAVFPTVLPTSEDAQNATPETPLDGVLNVTVSNGTHTQKAEFKTRFFMDFERFDFPMESGMTFIQYPGKEPEAENTPETGATWIPQNGMVCGTVSKSGFFTHPPYKKGTGTIFRVWDVDLARDFAGPVFFDASVGKKNDSDLGDGILYQIYVQEQGSEPGEWEKLAEVHIPTHEWKPISADLGPWAGKKIRLRLETNPGKNTSGDWGVWADLTFRTTEMTPIFEIVD